MSTNSAQAQHKLSSDEYESRLSFFLSLMNNYQYWLRGFRASLLFLRLSLPSLFSLFSLLIALTALTILWQATFFSNKAHAQELPSPKVLRLAEAEERMATVNLQILAANYGVEAARGAVVQVGLLPNPNLALEQSAFNARTGRVFEFSDGNSNTEVSLLQLIRTAGKRDAGIAVAVAGAQSTEIAVAELLRGLRYALRSNIIDLYFTREAIAFYDTSLAGVRRTVQSAEQMYARRTILLAEVLRLKSLLFTLENERLGLQSSADTLQGSLRLLLRDSAVVEYAPQLDRATLDSLRPDGLQLASLLAQARTSRSDVRLAETQTLAAERNIALQNALAVPDVALGARYSRSGSTFPDYFALQASIDLPVFNRNQGNIQSAEAILSGQRAALEQTQRGAEQDVVAAYNLARRRDLVLRSFDRTFVGEYRSLVQNITESYQKRNLSLIEFTDFYESYRTSMLQMNQLERDRADALEQLNYSVGAVVMPLR